MLGDGLNESVPLETHGFLQFQGGRAINELEALKFHWLELLELIRFSSSGLLSVPLGAPHFNKVKQYCLPKPR